VAIAGYRWTFVSTGSDFGCRPISKLGIQPSQEAFHQPNQSRKMTFFDNALEAEFNRWIDKAPNDPYASKDTVGLHEVIRAHFLILDFFSKEAQGEGIGGIGPKSLDLLQSAVYRQFVSFDGKDKWPTSFEKAATLLFGIVKNHPFHDANKRTGFLSTLLFLHKMDRIPRIKQRELEDFVVAIADDKLSKYARYKDLVGKVEDPEVQFIADFLRRSTRQIDRITYTLTFQELNQTLKRFGFELVNPKGNYIDIAKVEYDSTHHGPHNSQRIETKLAQIGFPGWKKQVSKNALRTVRTSTGLTAENGYDSQTFFHGVDPVNTLIDTYEHPLRRLAYR
jgi:death-on-curing family protein